MKILSKHGAAGAGGAHPHVLAAGPPPPPPPRPQTPVSPLDRSSTTVQASCFRPLLLFTRGHLHCPRPGFRARPLLGTAT